MKHSKTKVHKLLSQFDELKWKITYKGLLCGAIAGLLAVLYRLIIEIGNDTAIKIYAFLKLKPLFILPWILLIGGIGLVIAILIKIEPMASGSGIPQVEGVLLYGLKMKWKLVLFVRFVGGTLAAFCGLSLGREGPSIQVGAACGQALAENISNGGLEENYLVTGGAAAGLSAAFNAPLAAIIFTLEEVHRTFSPFVLIAATTAALTADFISKYFFGLKPVLSFTSIAQLPVRYYLWLIPLGIISGISGVIINKTLLGFQSLYNALPRYSRPCIALLIALPCGIFLPEILGGGQNLIKISESATSGIFLLLIYFIFKILFTSTSFGSGIPGGIFMPILAIGALSGSAFGIIATHFSLPMEYIPGFTVCAMAGALSASIKAPVTSILLIAEMTGSFLHILPVAVCSFIALLFSDMLKITPLYETLLERFAEKNGNEIPVKEKGGLLEVPVELGSSVANKKISEVKWPPGVLIVGLRRGQKEIVPNGKTKIIQGDYLVVLSAVDMEEDTDVSVKELCQAEQCPDSIELE